MNRTYKTIRKAFLSGLVCASEFAKFMELRRPRQVIKFSRNKQSFMIQVGMTLLLAGFGKSAFAQTLIYDGTNLPSQGVAILEPSSNIGSEFLTWIGIAPGDQGIIYRDSLSSVVPMNADLVIDYSSGTTPKFIIGGYSAMFGFTVSENTVRIINGAVDGLVYGGLSHNTIVAPDVTGLPTGTETSAVASVDISFGASSNARENIVNIGASNLVTGDVYGGNATAWFQASSATAGGLATVSASDETFVSAAASANASVDIGASTVSSGSNIVTVGESTYVNGHIFGGSANLVGQGGNSTANDAQATGIYAFAFAFANSYTFIYNSTITADANKVTVGENASISENIYGGAANLALQGGNATAGDAQATAASTWAYSYAHSYIDNSTVKAINNTVTVAENTSVAGNIYGGSANIMAKGGHAVAGNATAAGGFSYADAHSEISNSIITASGNDITIGDGSLVRGNIYGGSVALKAQAGHATGGTFNGISDRADANVDVSNTQVLANDNVIAFNGVLQNGSIYGGFAQFDIIQGTAFKADSSVGNNQVTLTDNMVQANNNIVTIGDNAQINGAVSSLYGGYLDYNAGFAPETYDLFSGNTLNFSAQPISLQKVANFEYYKFTLQPSLANTSTALISANEIELGVNIGNMDSSNQNGQTSKIKVVGIHSGNVLKAGDKFILMKATNSMTAEGNGETSTGVAQQGISLLYDVKTTVDSTNKKVTATILGDDTRLNPQLKALTEGYLYGSQLVTRGADLIADDAFKTIQEQDSQLGWNPFVVLSGQNNRYNSGSHIKSKDFLLAGGFSYQQNNIVAGAFLEGGWGSYDTYNNFNHVADVHGIGNGRYYGIGVLGRYCFASNFYTEASLRLGRNHIKFDTDDIQNLATGEFANYDFKNDYVSAHVGVGYLLPLTEKNQLDISAKYLYTTISGKSVIIGGDQIDFDRVDSNRARINATLNHHYNKAVTLNAGFGYEYEFDGKSGATTYGNFTGESPSLKGGTGIFSIGATIKPNSNLNLDFKLNGYTGKREGFGASVKINYFF